MSEVGRVKKTKQEQDDLDKIVDFCSSIVEIGASPLTREHAIESAGVEIPGSAFVLLRILDRVSPLSVSKLAELVALHPSTVSTQLRPLDDHAYVERDVDDVDRRVTWIRITRAGRAVIRRVRAVSADKWRIVLGSWSAQDRRLLAELLDRARTDMFAAIHAELEENAAFEFDAPAGSRRRQPCS